MIFSNAYENSESCERYSSPCSPRTLISPTLLRNKGANTNLLDSVYNLLQRQMAKWSPRADGRGPSCARQARIDASTLSTSGSAEVTLGGTSVVAAISLQVGQPTHHEPKCGDLGARFSSRASRGDNRRDNAPRSTSLTAPQKSRCASPRRASLAGRRKRPRSSRKDCCTTCSSGRSPRRARAPVAYNRFRRTLARTNKRGQVLDREQLCIIEGQAAWKLRLDLVCVSFAGSLVDAALMAAEAALRDLRLPEPVLSDSGQIQIHAEPARGSGALRLRKSVVALTCGVFQGREVVADPTDDEEGSDDLAIVTVVLDRTSGHVVALLQPAGGLIAPDTLAACLDLTRSCARVR